MSTCRAHTNTQTHSRACYTGTRKMDRQFNGCFFNFSHFEDENIIYNARMISVFIGVDLSSIVRGCLFFLFLFYFIFILDSFFPFAVIAYIIFWYIYWIYGALSIAGTLLAYGKGQRMPNKMRELKFVGRFPMLNSSGVKWFTMKRAHPIRKNAFSKSSEHCLHNIWTVAMKNSLLEMVL